MSYFVDQIKSWYSSSFDYVDPGGPFSTYSILCNLTNSLGACYISSIPPKKGVTFIMLTVFIDNYICQTFLEPGLLEEFGDKNRRITSTICLIAATIPATLLIKIITPFSFRNSTMLLFSYGITWISTKFLIVYWRNLYKN